MSSGPIHSLTATRGIAALLVVLFHLGQAPHGFLSVSYFFTLSGFIMCFTYAERPLPPRDFFIRRVARIVPVYLFALLLCVALAVMLRASGTSLPPTYGLQVALNALLAQAYVPGFALSVNFAAWSLSVELFFYLLFPVLVLAYRRNRRGFCGAALALFVVSQALHVAADEAWEPVVGTPLHDLVFYHPLGHLGEFVLGMAAHALVPRGARLGARFVPLLFAAAVVLAVRVVPVSLNNGLLAPLFAGLVLALVAQRRPFPSPRPAVYLGEISYGIYILQAPVILTMTVLNELHFGLSYHGFVVATLVVLLALSSASYHLLEQPLRARINRLARG